MKKLTKKQIAIIQVSIICVLLGVLLYFTVDIVRTAYNKINKKQASIEVASNIPEAPKEEVIEEEELAVEENKEEQKKSTKKQANKNTNTTNNNAPQVVSDKTYYLKINYGANTITIYTKNEEGNYTIPVKAMVCSTGRATPRSGTYKLKGKWRWHGLKGGLYGQYCAQVVGNILIHSVPYLRNGDPASLEYWEYDKLRNGMFCRMY